MLQITTRKTEYLTKSNWLDYSQETRELGVKKSILDLLSYYAELNEMTNFKIFKGKELKYEFSIEDFKNENVELSLFVASRLITTLVINEEYQVTGEKLELGIDENGNAKTKAEKILKVRNVEMTF